MLLALYLIRLPFHVHATSNPIQQENQLPGTTSWQLTNPDSYVNNRYSTIEGFSWATSVSAGNTLSFSVSTTAPTYTADVYRLGWYQGAGARLITTLSNLAGSFQQSGAMDPTTGLVDNNWPQAFTLTPDSTWVSGMYLVKLTASTGKQSYIPFSLTDTRASDFVFVHAENTSQAYNAWGGKSLYEFNSTSNKRAYKVSFDRPQDRNTGAGDLLNWEYPTLRWIEKNGYDVSYVSDVDVHVNPSLLQNHKAILLVGHSEYWTKEMRDNLEADVGAGMNLGVFAANTMGWQIRYEPQPFGTQPLPNRVIVCYKDATLDPLNGVDNSHVTVMFRDPPVNRPEQSILGDSFNDYNSSTNFPWVVSDASSWLFAGTGLHNGDSIAHMVGYEYDVVLSYFPIPPGDDSISTSPVTGSDGTHSTSNSTLYTAASGARVFDSGSMNWNWGLDSYASPGDPHPDYTNANVQLITQNLFQNFLSAGTPTPTSTVMPTPTPTQGPNLLQNPSFETGIPPWFLNINNGAGTLTQDTSTAAPGGGAASALMHVTQSLGDIYDLSVIQQQVALTAGQQYTVSYWAKADTAGRQVLASISQAYSPYSSYASQSFNVTTSWQTLDEVHQHLLERLSLLGLSISRREVLYLFEAYCTLLRAAQQSKEGPEWQTWLKQVEANGGIILSIDGIQPDNSNETIYLVRDVLTGHLLCAENVTSSETEVIKALLRPVVDLGVPVLAGANSLCAEQQREQEHLEVLADYTLAIGTALNPRWAKPHVSTQALPPTMRSLTLMRGSRELAKKGDL
jgi:hypothetical protein